MPELEKSLKPLILSELRPPMNVSHITDSSGLEELKAWIEKKRAEEQVPVVGIDTETNVVNDFWFRKVRTVQIGDRDKQFVIDLLAYISAKLNVSFEEAGQILNDSQGHYGKNYQGIYDEILSILEPIICTNEWLKVGQNLAFEYSVFHWNFGKRIWNLFSTDMAERVIQAGTIPLKKMAEFSMSAIVSRQFGLKIDKSEQEGFDLKTPLNLKQILYAAFDVRMPLAMRQYQINVMTVDQLLTTTQIENDAIGTFTDMHLCGQNLDDERWLKRIQNVIERRQEELKILDEGFIPLMGRKNEQIDEVKLARLEDIWKSNFESATPKEMELAAQKRQENNKEKKAEIAEQLKLEQKKRVEAKVEARSKFSELKKLKTKALKMIEKCEGEAFLNYGSTPQLLEALRKLPGMKTIQDTSDDTLLRFNDRPLIQVLRKYRKGKKDTGTYGVQWTQKWITKPLKSEGWRHPGDGRLHCIFGQLEAETGRTSSSKPNGQNLPKDEEVRACFIASPPTAEEPDGFYIVTIDMEGAELRIIAELADAASWITAFAKGQDVHSVSCEILYPEKWPALKESDCAYYALNEQGEPKRQKCKCKGHVELRASTKATNFLLCYGGGPDALADAIGSTVEVAKEIMELHKSKFPDIWGFLEKSGEKAKERKEARDMYGRRRSFPTPTWQMAKEWFKNENEKKLELDEEDQEKNITDFKIKNLREPNEEEEYKLTHRSPTEGEIKQGYRALMGSIGRRGKNHCIQGTNASIIKRAMGSGLDASGKGYLWHLLPKYKAHIVSMVHDELVLECPKRYAQEVAEVVADAFKRAAAEVMHKVVMTADYHIADCWQK